ncbi:collectin-10 isoform X2 [Chanos chanos]|uniref:Collectin-10 isoform X2 n=1 Tax=Chanos chanos TaxID=29144 RepID=A0A6J2VYU7_CHACN|nr:collectin-10 isoform X2 [Chanos chanos]
MVKESFSWTLLLFFVLYSRCSVVSASEVCSNTILPGSKGDPGEVGDEGDQGRLGKPGPPGHTGLAGNVGTKGEDGLMGKMGPMGDRGDKGEKGVDGPPGIKGKSGASCDCSRYRKVVWQMNINIGKLKNAVKFLKDGIKETEEKFYLIVKEARKFREALLNCKLRGGSLAMPRSADVNALLAGYVSEASLTHVFIGLQPGEVPGTHVYADQSPLTSYAAWGPEEPRGANVSCVQLDSAGSWSHAECDATKYYLCEFLKSRTVSAATQ